MITNSLGSRMVAPEAIAPVKKTESLCRRIWTVVRNILLSSAFFWGVSQSFFIAGLVSGAVFYRQHREFGRNAAVWWEMSGWPKCVFALLFAIVAFPFLAKSCSFLWAAYISSGEISSALEYKQIL